MSEGFTDYLTKPIESLALEKMLIKYLPEDKVERIQEEVKPEDPKTDNTEDEFAVLREAGIDSQTGLHYCQNEKEFYRSLLAEYAHGKTEKTENIKTNYADENWHEYAIYVHALKSTSKMIGAAELSQQAARLEAAANAGKPIPYMQSMSR